MYVEDTENLKHKVLLNAHLNLTYKTQKLKLWKLTKCSNLMSQFNIKLLSTTHNLPYVQLLTLYYTWPW